MDHFYQTLPGYVGPIELEILKQGVELTKEGGIIIEVGTCCGYCTAFLLVEIQNSGKNIHLVTCDLFPYPEDEDNVRKFTDGYNVRVFKGKSLDLPYNTADFVFLDGNHDYENVKQELIKFFDILKPGGMIAGHDYGHDSYPGVKQAVDEFCKEKGIELNADFSFYFTK